MRDQKVTVEETITQTLTVWAIPQSQWHIDNYPDEGYFYYEVKTNKPYETGAIQVCEDDHTFTVPAGISLADAAIETYKEAIAAKQAQCYVEVSELHAKINSLLLLEHTVDE